MKTFIEIGPQHFADLANHLLPADSEFEEAAFLFAEVKQRSAKTVLTVRDIWPIKKKNFATQAWNYLELDNEHRASIIKQAHAENLAIIESHSHRGPYSAIFSLFDIEGLRETVQHMMWRLKSRPYGALVFADSGYDALVWLDDAIAAQKIEGIRVGEQLMRPTNRSIELW